MEFHDGKRTRVRTGWLDRWPARLAALVILIGCISVLVLIHWSDIFPSQTERSQADDPAAACIATRGGEVDRMHADGVIDETQVASFKARAEAFCRAQAGQVGVPVPPAH